MILGAEPLELVVVIAKAVRLDGAPRREGAWKKIDDHRAAAQIAEANDLSVGRLAGKLGGGLSYGQHVRFHALPWGLEG